MKNTILKTHGVGDKVKRGIFAGDYGTGLENNIWVARSKLGNEWSLMTSPRHDYKLELSQMGTLRLPP